MSLQRTLGAVAALSLTFATGTALADKTACGAFDFSGGLDCKIEVSGGCSAKCVPLQFESGCTGQCTTMATTDCTGSCGTQCIAQCDPSKLDCFEGCHNECDGPVQADCTKNNGTDCVNTARAQCDIHCRQVCKVKTDTTCQEHCTKCCTGSCTTQINTVCDTKCFSDLKGGCDVQCKAPSGALFCNGQYVHASDIQACIDYLLTQGFHIDARASASIKCDLSGCEGFAGVSGIPFVGSKGCSASGADPLGTGLGASGLAAAGIAMAVSTIRRRRRVKAK